MHYQALKGGKPCYYLLPNADRRVFLWAIAHSDIRDCLIEIQWPFEYRWWGRQRRLVWRGLIRLNIPTYLIQEYGEVFYGDPDWDTPF